MNYYYRERTSGISGDRSEPDQIERFSRQVDIWRSLKSEPRDLILLGDANFFLLSPHNPDYPQHLKNISNIATDFYIEEGISPLIDQFTRTELKRDRIEKSCLDHIHTSTP